MKKIQIVSLTLAFLMCVSLLFIPLFDREAEVTSTEQLQTVTDKTVTLASSVESSHAGVVGEFVAFYDRGQLSEFEFIVKDVLYGNVPESRIIVTHQLTSNETALVMDENTYEAGEEYVLILHRFESLFLEYARYYIVNDIHIPYNDTQSAVMNGSPLAIIGDVKSTVKNIANTNGYSEEEKRDIYRTENLETVVKDCDAIIEIRVLGVAAEGVLHNGTTYTCQYINSLTGNDVPVNPDGNLFVVSFRDSLLLGNTYYLTVSAGDSSSVVYTLASPQGIIPTYDASAYEQIVAWLTE